MDGVHKNLKHFVEKTFSVFEGASTLYTSRKSLQHLLATGVPNCEEPWSAHEQTCKISREELPHPIKQRRDEQSFLCLSALPVQAPHFGRLLC